MFALLALAVQEPVLAPDAEGRWVPFELTAANQIRFEMQAGGRSASAILDTGFTDTVASASFARTLKLKPRGQGSATAIGGSVAIRWADSPALALAGLRRSGGRIGIADMSAAGDQAADLYIGADLLACCALDIDYAARRFRILPSGRMPFAGLTAPLAQVRGSGTFVTELRVGERRLRPILVDTGDGSWLTLTREAWSQAIPAGARVTTTLGYGLGGPVVTEAAIAADILLAGRATGELEVRKEAAAGYSATTGTAGRIGSGLLMRYRVLLDPRAGRMVLLPEPGAAGPAIRSTSGLLFAYSEGALAVAHVMRGSPAAESGWKAGERICAADGVLVAEDVAGDGLVDWGVGAPGRTVRLTLCNGAERRLTLRRFY